MSKFMAGARFAPRPQVAAGPLPGRSTLAPPLPMPGSIFSGGLGNGSGAGNGLGMKGLAGRGIENMQFAPPPGAALALWNKARSRPNLPIPQIIGQKLAPTLQVARATSTAKATCRTATGSATPSRSVTIAT